MLIRARVAHGWTKKQLAGLLGVTEQTIQRCEATDYQGVALARIAKIADPAAGPRSGRAAVAAPIAGTD